jgi:hypothetical protein
VGGPGYQNLPLTFAASNESGLAKANSCQFKPFNMAIIQALQSTDC